jgi:predicted DNA-binding helix-hairpin-helix protein
MKVSLNQQIEELAEELDMRISVYGRMVSSGKMRQAVADYKMERMRAALNTLRWLREAEVWGYVPSLHDDDRTGA